MRSVILLCVAFTGALFVSSALAGSPTRDRVPIGTVLAVIPTESACPAASAGVRITDVGGNLTFTTFVTQGIVSVVPQGSGFEVRAAGTPLWVFYPGDAGPGDTTTGRMYLYTGLSWATQDASQTNLSFASVGRAQDVCAMIA